MRDEIKADGDIEKLTKFIGNNVRVRFHGLLGVLQRVLLRG